MMERKGCAAAMFVMGVLLTFGFVFMGGRTPFGGPGDPGTKQSQAVGTVGKQTISVTNLQDGLEQVNKQYAGQSHGATDFLSDPMARSLIYQQVVGQVVSMAALASVADDLGIKLDDKQVIAEWRKIADDQKTQMIGQLKMMGKLKEGATQADVDKAVNEGAGGDFTKLVDSKIAQVTLDLANPATALTARAPALQNALKTALEAQVKVTEEDLKASFDEFTYDAINFTGKDVNFDAARLAAGKAAAELKSGKSFEEVQKSYNVKDQQTTASIPRNMLDNDEKTKSLVSLKPGEVSEVVERFGQVQILRMKSMVNKLPADFEKNKATLLKQFKDSQVQKKENDLVKAKSDREVKWSSPGLELFYRYVQSNRDSKLNSPGAERTAALNKILAESKKLTDPVVFGRQANAYLQVAVANDLYISADNADKPKYARERMDALLGALAFTDNAKMRYDIATLAKEVGDKDVAFKQITESAKSNGNYTKAGLDLYAQQVQLLADLQKANLVTADQVPIVQAELDKWQKDKMAWEKDQADLSKEQADVQKQGKAEQDRLKADEQQAIEAEKAKAAGTAVPKTPAGTPKDGTTAPPQPDTGAPKPPSGAK